MSRSGMKMEAKMKSFACLTCGWTVKSPFGENDIIEHANLHANNHHLEMRNTPRADLEKLIKNE